jgi:hypothetical protein
MNPQTNDCVSGRFGHTILDIFAVVVFIFVADKDAFTMRFPTCVIELLFKLVSATDAVEYETAE